jgi:hypothetical protein
MIRWRAFAYPIGLYRPGAKRLSFLDTCRGAGRGADGEDKRPARPQQSDLVVSLRWDEKDHCYPLSGVTTR